MLILYRLCRAVCAVVLIFQGFSLIAPLLKTAKKDISGQQQPPLPVNPEAECHIVDAVPLLRKKYYKSYAYRLTELKAKPLTIQETIAAGKLVDLKIEQRGCEDIYAEFNFTFKRKKNQGIKRNLEAAARILNNLKTNSAALLNSKTVLKIAEIALNESKKVKPFKNDVVCLNQIQSECITDVSFKDEYPHLKIFYVDRP